MITQKFPFLLPIRVAQRKAFFYTAMRRDGRAYAQTIQDQCLPHKLCFSEHGLYNADTGFDMIYQENKVYNLKLAANTLNGLLIKPGETFSFWLAVRHANKHTPYKDGLVFKNGQLGISAGGGLCQMSNLLFWLFLHSPLTIAERHTHRIQGFPTSLGTGMDATVSEGWLDLKVTNETDTTFQIGIDFSGANISGMLYTDRALPAIYEIEGKDLAYFRENGVVRQEISIYRREIDSVTRRLCSESLLYRNVCVIGYQLPDYTPISEEGDRKYEQKKNSRDFRRLLAGI